MAERAFMSMPFSKEKAEKTCLILWNLMCLHLARSRIQEYIALYTLVFFRIPYTCARHQEILRCYEMTFVNVQIV